MQQFGGEERCPLSDDDADRHSAELDFRSAFDDAPIGMAVCAPGVILRVNAALVRLLGRSAEDLVGSDLLDITHPEDLAEARVAAASLGEHRMVRYECRLLGERGQEIPVSVSASVVVDGGGERGHQVMHFEDIGDRRRLEIELTFRALHDPLTGLPNRTLFVDRTQHALVRAHRSQVSTTSSRSTTPTGTPWVMRCSWSSGADSAPWFARAIRPRAWAVTSSPCSAKTPMPTRRRRWRPGCGRWPRNRSRTTASAYNSAQRPASALPRRNWPWTVTGCCGLRTRRCMRANDVDSPNWRAESRWSG